MSHRQQVIALCYAIGYDEKLRRRRRTNEMVSHRANLLLMSMCVIGLCSCYKHVSYTHSMEHVLAVTAVDDDHNENKKII